MAAQSINLVQLAQNLPAPRSRPAVFFLPTFHPLKERQGSFLPPSGFHDIYFENHCPRNVILSPGLKASMPGTLLSFSLWFPIEVTLGAPVPSAPHSCLLDLLFCISGDHFNSRGLKDHSLLSEGLPDCLKVPFHLPKTLGPCRAQLTGSEGSWGRIRREQERGI